jgi:hypothetical protein
MPMPRSPSAAAMLTRGARVGGAPASDIKKRLIDNPDGQAPKGGASPSANVPLKESDKAQKSGCC